jgi:uncharacterized protein (DUF2236 family)
MLGLLVRPVTWSLGLVGQPVTTRVRRDVIAQLERVGSQGRFPQEQYDEPAGDPGLFGPDSVVWRVHSHPAMIVGGLSALMLQTLHPLAMAGVAEHSNFKEDPEGRLARTSSFVDGTTFGSREVAETLCAIVERIHRRVKGVTPDERPYSANDPALLRWVHVTEADSFVRAYQRFARTPLTGAETDRYFEEFRVVAEMLGATDVPASRAEVDAYFDGIRPQLYAGEQAKDTFRFILTPSTRDARVAVPHLVIARAAIHLLPPWARDLLGAGRFTVLDPLSVNTLTLALVEFLAWVSPNPRMVAARERVARGTSIAAA